MLATLAIAAAIRGAQASNLSQIDLPQPPPMAAEFRGVWVATVDNIDWPSSRTLSTAAQQKELLRILDVAQSMRLNAILFQVRPAADALYASRLEPWSEYLTGKQGRAPSPKWDPLEFVIQEAHSRGMEVHAWFNPYRAKHPAQKGPTAANHIARKYPWLVKPYGRFLWMDPGEPAVAKISHDVLMDVVRRYDVDGIHIDDYFYPYQEKDSRGRLIPFPDAASYTKYRKRGGGLAKPDWRRKNVDDFIETIYRDMKTEKPWVKFGISPFGVYRPGQPAGIQAGVDQFADLYADARKWLREGWCDYYTPQLYWPIAQKPQSFPVLLDYWMGENRKDRHIWPGLFTSRVMPGTGTWQPTEVTNQIAITRERGSNGTVHFSMKPFLLDSRGIRKTLELQTYRAPATVPASPWLGSEPPLAPVIEELFRKDAAHVQMGLAAHNLKEETPHVTGQRIRFYAHATATKLGDSAVWSPWKLTSDRDITLNAGGQEVAVAVANVGYSGLWGPVITRELPTSP